MDELVCFEGDSTGETFATLIADKDLFPCVRDSVAVKILWQVKAAATHITTVWLLAGVYDRVCLELCLL